MARLRAKGVGEGAVAPAETTEHDADGAPKGAVPDSDEQYSLRRSPQAARQRARLEQRLSAIVRRILGDRVTVKFEDTLPVSGEATGWGSYAKGKTTAAGSYVSAQALIRLALADPKYAGSERSTVYHEAFHAVEDKIWNNEGPDLAIVARERDRLENWILANMRFEPGITKAELQGVTGREIRAIAFEGYAQQRDQGAHVGGIHIAIRRGFEKLLAILRRVRNWLQGLGYRTAEDVFRDIYEGRMREAADRAERSTLKGAAAADRGEQYSIRRTRPSAPVPPGTPRRVPAKASEQGVPKRPPPRPPDKAAQSDRKNSGARASGPFDSNARRAEVTAPGSRVAPESGGATFGSARSKHYRTTFFEPNQKLRGEVFVHHAVEQQVLTKYPGVATEAEMHSLENLRGIPRHLNSELHLSKIRREWNRFYQENPTTTRRKLLKKATEIDAKYGSHFNPPIKPGR